MTAIRRPSIGRIAGRLLLQVGAIRYERVGRPEPIPQVVAPDHSRSRFEIFTFVTERDQYEAMIKSFADAGFAPPDAAFTRLTDGRGGGTPDDPFKAINRLAQRTSGYAILCHQDVRLDRGAGLTQLGSLLQDLDQRDPAWVVAGNAGVGRDMRLVKCLYDPYGAPTSELTPSLVMSLDENFLVFNRLGSPRCSQQLDGFHLYGTDVCLNAIADGKSAYVIDFPLTHLSGGSRHDEAYREARRRFIEAWNDHWALGYIGTPNDVIFVSRWPTLRRLFGSTRAMSWVAAAAGR